MSKVELTHMSLHHGDPIIKFWLDDQPYHIEEALRLEVTCRRAYVVARILANVEVCPDTGCWVWRGSCSGNGRGGSYGRIKLSGHTMAVHRAMWMTLHGPISSKKQVDHRCRNRRCCNPAHLEAVTHRENQRRRARDTASTDD